MRSPEYHPSVLARVKAVVPVEPTNTLIASTMYPPANLIPDPCFPLESPRTSTARDSHLGRRALEAVHADGRLSGAVGVA